MPDKPRKSIKRALRDERQVLAKTAYAGDLATDVLPSLHPCRRWGPLLVPVLATAVIAIGLIIGIAISQGGNVEPANAPIVLTPPITPEPQPPTPAATQGQMPLAPTSQVAESKLPEIDRDLLPLQRTNQRTWLASAKAHSDQLDKQSRLAEHPDPGKRVRVTLSAPTRRTIDRTLTRPLSIKPTPKPERNS